MDRRHPDRFRRDELVGSDLPTDLTDDPGLVDAARVLERLAEQDDVRPSPDFVSRVTAAIAVEPRPRAGQVVRRGMLAGLVAAATAAWRVAVGIDRRPLTARAQAFALLAILVVGTGTVAGLGVAGAVNLLTPDRTPAPSLLPVSPPPSGPVRTESPAINPSRSPSTVPSSPSPSESAEPTDREQPSNAEPSEGAGPSRRPGASEDAEESADPEDSEEPEDSKSGRSGTTPRPTRTPRPTETPRASRTPRPPEPTDAADESDDHGGSGGGSSPTP